jgi:hypothetical protein
MSVDAISPDSNAVTGKIEISPSPIVVLTEKERLHEIDMRVGARLAEREILRGEYVRGVLDTVTIVFFIAALVYITFFLNDGEEI